MNHLTGETIDVLQDRLLHSCSLQMSLSFVQVHNKFWISKQTNMKSELYTLTHCLDNLHCGDFFTTKKYKNFQLIRKVALFI